MAADQIPGEQERVDFFISYTGKDRAWAEWIAMQLETAGYHTLIQAWDFRPGSNFVEAMDEAARRAERTLLVLSPAYLQSDYTFAEWAAAFRRDPRGKQGRVLPVRIERCEVEGLLGPIIFIDLVNLSEQQARERSLHGVKLGRAKPEITSFPGAPTSQVSLDRAIFPPSLPALWNVPYPQNALFTGREELLTKLATTLQAGQPTALSQPQAISVLGGIGKTQLALEFAYRYRHDYQAVLWAQADSRETLTSSYLAKHIEDWLKTCQTLVLFDGLDEVSDKALQQEIQQAIHDFITQQRHPDVEGPAWNRFMITSRIADYHAPALERYRYFLVAELSREQISDFLPRWYGVSTPVGENSGHGSAVRTRQCIDELLAAYQTNEAVRNLAGNPLLLTLMAIMLQNGTRLPERRVELYQAVTKTLLESRNEIKGLPKLDADEAIQRLGQLAFTMQGVGNNLAHRVMVEAALRTAILAQRQNQVGSPQVEQEVHVYIEVIGKRGGLFLQRTADYYGFIHRSFQEYFAARHMLREIEVERDQKIEDYVQLVRDHPGVWRDPFILAVAFKSDGDGGPVATAMLRCLLDTTSSNTQLSDVLLAATCITEAKSLNLEVTLKQEVAERLLSRYEQAQHVQRFDECEAIEQAVGDWLAVLREQETYLELPQTLQGGIIDSRHPTHQKAVLTLLVMISGRLQRSAYNLCDLLIPSLLALAALDAVPPYTPAAGIAASTDLDVADLCLTLLSFMGQRGPAGLLLKGMHDFFKNQPRYLEHLARFSLEGGTLMTPVFVPVEEERFEHYCDAIARWITLRDEAKRSRRTERKTRECLSVLQATLDCAEEVNYPVLLYFQEMLQRSAADPARWRTIWQSSLLAQLDHLPSVHYPSLALLWVTLFPEPQDAKTLADHITHYQAPHALQRKSSYHFLSVLSQDLRALRALRDLKALRDLNYLRGLRDSRALRALRDLREIRDLRAFLFTQDIAEQARTVLLSQGNAPESDLLTLLMGRLLHVQEEQAMGPQIEAEVQQLAAVAFDYLRGGNVLVEIFETALEIVRVLPARTANEIGFVLQMVPATTDHRVSQACAIALNVATPADQAAWQALEQGKTLPVPDVKEVVEYVWKRRT